MSSVIDLRSDTVTQPTNEMRRAIAEAVVGDDGYEEDPTVNELECTFASMLAKPAAVFVPSGVMANQIALRILTRPGDVVLSGKNQHTVGFEMGAAASNASVQFALVNDERGIFDNEEILSEIDAEHDHRPAIAMAIIENSHMYSGGVPWSAKQTHEAVSALGGRPVHLDGARLFNASVALNESVATLAAPATTVAVALSKGLCAPVGSMLAGSHELMARARVERKRLGGAMRQVGFLAAAGLVGLRTMVDRLGDDHAHAAQLAAVCAQRFPESDYDPATCRTNIVAFEHPRARQLRDDLATLGVLTNTLSPHRFRMVTHANVTGDQIDRACAVIAEFRWS